VHGTAVRLLKPTTYMNRSGAALAALRGLRGVDVPAGEVVLRILAVRPFGALARPIHASFRRGREQREES